MIDSAAIAQTAADQVAENGLLLDVLTTPEIVNRTMHMIAVSIPLAAAVALDKESMQVLQILLSWYWQMGRLYGQQEVMDGQIEKLEL